MPLTRPPPPYLHPEEVDHGHIVDGEDYAAGLHPAGVAHLHLRLVLITERGAHVVSLEEENVQRC